MEIASSCNAMEQGVQERDAGGDRITVLQQSSLQAQSSGTPIPQPDLHREMWARVKEFDGDDDKWLGWWSGVKNLNKAVLSNVDKNHAPEDGEPETAVQDAVDELNKNPVADNDKLDMAARDTSDRLRTDHTAENGKIDTLFYELQSGERMADTVKRGVLLIGLAPLPEVQKLNSCAQMIAEAVDLLRVEATLHMPMDVDGACMSGPKGKGKTKGESKSDDTTGQGQAKDKVKNGKETRVCHECDKPGYLRKDGTVHKRRVAEKGGNKEDAETTAAVQGATAAVQQGAMVETWEYTEDDFVVAFGEVVIAACQRPRLH